MQPAPIDILIVASRAGLRNRLSRNFSQIPQCASTIRTAPSLEDAVTLLANAPTDLLIVELDIWLQPCPWRQKILQLRATALAITLICPQEREQEAAALLGLQVDNYLVQQRISIRECALLARSRVRIAGLQQECEKQEIVQRRTRMIFSILSSLAHNLNNPLCGISGLLQLHLMNNDIDAELAAQMQEMLSLSHDMAQSVQYLFKLVSHGHETVSEFEIDDLLTAAVESRSVPANRAGIMLTTTLLSRARLEGRRGDLQHAMEQLIDNAIESSATGDSIALHSEANATHCIITLVDQGSGMSDDVLYHAFDPYYSTRQGWEHSGLGLTLAKSVIERFKGTIGLHSQRTRGTTVTITLPLVL